MAGPRELERWLNKATDPSIPEENWECIQRFCDQVNTDAEGPSLAPRLLAHKIQSPQEMEALHALTVLETCVNNCGERFHSEIAKFRFLNELIKVLSPKYHGTWSSEKVKSRVTEIIFSWTVWFPQEVKIRDAYQMLKKQGIVKEDPKLPEDKILPPPSPRPQNSIFDTDEEKSKLLARLLKSNHSEDLQAANRLIKSMIKEEQEKSAKVSRRANTISEVSENVKLMNELLDNYKRQELSKSDRDTLQNLSERCEKLRPLLFRLASETVDDDEALAEILQANDKLTQALGQYKQIVASHEDSGGGSVASSTDAPGLISVTLSAIFKACQTPPRRMKSYTLIDFSELEATSQSSTDQFSKIIPASRHSSTASTSLLDEELTSLDFSNSPVLQKPPYDFGSAEAAVHNGYSEIASAVQTLGLKESWEESCLEKNEFQGLAEQLSPPSRRKTLSLDPAPGRPDVLVMVLSMLSTSAQPIKDIEFQAAVPKTMKIKLQPASGSELPAFSPFLPPAVISQVLLLANPHKNPIRLRYKLMFVQGVQPFSEVGEVTGFPEAELWSSS
ncbi:ADP-ribosylation factor-binding protein GGA2 isoform X3 [Dromaius novaehollandiae]|uniref:ADP-ribosylation factor-binding protein GGA2 isoform X3 n=1 Tax=Dromaius novaehollandiae TaxID=8790 RepID=UPI00311F0489